jgi:hypothetical protein
MSLISSKRKRKRFNDSQKRGLAPFLGTLLLASLREAEPLFLFFPLMQGITYPYHVEGDKGGEVQRTLPLDG